jgi:pyruvate/2-oxoglutarate dehydrogenase complex dihydrolipoamide acyltransferase (E2) component
MNSLNNLENAFAKISKKTGLSIKELKALTKDDLKFGSPFSSSAAKELFKEYKLVMSDVKPTGKNSKITADDVRRGAGKPVKTKEENLFASKNAKDLAESKGWTQKDFKNTEKSGKPRKSGAITITLKDVKNKAGILNSPKKNSAFSSPTAEKFAKDNKLKSKDINGTGKNGKITKKDIQNFINSVDESEVDESEVDESEVDESEVDESEVDESKVDESKVDE